MNEENVKAIDKAYEDLKDALYKLHDERQNEISLAIDALIEAHLEAFADRIQESVGVRP